MDYATINRWALKFAPLPEHKARRIKKPVSSSWGMDETYIKVEGEWLHYYRTVDKLAKSLITKTVIIAMRQLRKPS